MCGISSVTNGNRSGRAEDCTEADGLNIGAAVIAGKLGEGKHSKGHGWFEEGYFFEHQGGFVTCFLRLCSTSIHSRYKPFVEACIVKEESDETLKYIIKLRDFQERAEAYACIGMVKEATEAAAQVIDSELLGLLKSTFGQNTAAGALQY